MTMSRLRIALAASLLVNLFVVGSAVGGLLVLSRQERGPPHACLAHRPMRSAGAVLPASDRRAFRRLLRQTFADNRDLLADVRENRGQAAALFTRQPFDAAAVTASLERARLADTAMRRRLEQAAIGFAASLPYPERMALARGLSRCGPLRGQP